MFRSASFFAPIFAFLTGCPASNQSACGDAAYWAQRGASWPTDALYLGDQPLDQSDALDLLDLPPQNGIERLANALVVAELNLADGNLVSDMAPVYAAHAWFANHDGGNTPGDDAEASTLAIVLQEAQVCEQG